jgi:hypothetical protein
MNQGLPNLLHICISVIPEFYGPGIFGGSLLLLLN